MLSRATDGRKAQSLGFLRDLRPVPFFSGLSFPMDTMGRRLQGGEQSGLDNLHVPFSFICLFWAELVPSGATAPPDAALGFLKNTGV